MDGIAGAMLTFLLTFTATVFMIFFLFLNGGAHN